MGDRLARWWVHTVTVETWLGQAGMGPTWAPPTQVACWYQESTKLVRDAEGNDVLTSAQLAASVDTAKQFTPDTRVTGPTGKTGRVVTVSVGTSGPLALPDHVEVTIAWSA